MAPRRFTGGRTSLRERGLLLHNYSIVGLVILIVFGSGLLVSAMVELPAERLEARPAWSSFRFGFVVYSLIFLSFDMEMIFMYPWAVVFADIGLKAFLDMFVFIGILSAGIAYAWGMGGLKWE